MVSVKRQIQTIENAYTSDTLNRSVMDSVDDKAIRKVLREALQPWYYVYQRTGTWLGAAAVALLVYFLTGYIKREEPDPQFPVLPREVSLSFQSRFLWSVAIAAVGLISLGAYTWWTSDYKSKLGMVWVMFREDEERLTRLLKKMDVHESRVADALAYGSRNALVRKIDAMISQLKNYRQRVKNIPREIEQEQEALAAALMEGTA